MRVWTPEEDDILRDGVKQLGRSWARIAPRISGRTPHKFYTRWSRVLDPELRKEYWLPDEDEHLRNAYTRVGNNWRKVSSIVGTRSSFECRHRFYSWRAVSERYEWTGEEDDALDAAVIKFGPSWDTIASFIPGPTFRQCRARWTERWLSDAHERLHNARAEVGNVLPSAEKYRKGHWLPNELMRFKAAESDARNGNWSLVSIAVGTRSNN